MARLIALFLGLGLFALAVAAPVTLRLPNGLQARAYFESGEPGKPAVLIMHGFLQTYEFPTIHRLAENLADEGFTVLAPNLSLDVPLRRQSLACEAIHTHTLEKDVEEIDAWLNWLGRRHKGPAVLIGHSVGSMILLGYGESHPKTRVRKLIGVSLVEGRLKPDESARKPLLDEMLRRIAQGDQKPVIRQFSYCQNMTATPASHASYLGWSPERVLRAVRKSPIPTVFIMGSLDDRLGENWIDQLKNTQATVHVVKGANHFMDGEHEFDLLELILKELKGL